MKQLLRTIYDVVNAVVLVVVLILAGVFAWLVLQPPFLNYPKLPFRPLIAAVHPGEVMPLEVLRCNTDDVTHTYFTSRRLVSETEPPIILPATLVSIEPGCHLSISQINGVPLNGADGKPIKPGTWRVEGYAQVDGVIRTHIVPWFSQPFEVLPPEAPVPPPSPNRKTTI